MLLLLGLIASAAVAAALVSRYDLYQREPWYVVAGVIGLGAAAMAAAGPVEDWLILTVASPPSAARIAAVAALVEELARFAIVLGLAWSAPRYFNDPIDGLIYGLAAGIGMALEETTVYLAREAAGPLSATLPVEMVRLFGHVIMGGITGFGLGMVHCRRLRRMWAATAALCLLAGVTIHFLWDWIALRGLMQQSSARQVVLGSLALTIASTTLYGVLVVTGSRASRAVFAPGSDVRVWRGRSTDSD